MQTLFACYSDSVVIFFKVIWGLPSYNNLQYQMLRPMKCIHITQCGFSNAVTQKSVSFQIAESWIQKFCRYKLPSVTVFAEILC